MHKETKPTVLKPDHDGGLYVIPEFHLDGLRDRIERLARRAKRLHLSPITLTVEAHEDRPIMERVNRTFDYAPTGEMFRWLAVRVIGETPRLNGWTFTATLQHLHGEDGATINVLRTVPGFETGLPEQYRTAGPACDHCRTARYRIDTFVVHHDDGRWAQIGRNCLADYIGGVNPQSVAAMAEIIAEACAAAGGAEDYDDDGEGFGGGSRARRIDTEAFLAYVSETIHRCGWVSRRESGETDKSATVDLALRAMFPDSYTPKDLIFAPSEQAKAEAKAALAWAEAAFDREGLSDYEWNLKAALASSSVDDRLTGIVASLISCYRRATAREIERSRQAAVSQHFGTVGKRGDFTLTVSFTRELQSDWGVTTLVKFLDATGNVAVWFASGNPEVEMGHTYRVRATVKKHDTRDGVAQTVLTRAKIEGKAPEVQGTANGVQAGA